MGTGQSGTVFSTQNIPLTGKISKFPTTDRKNYRLYSVLEMEI